MVSNPKPKSKTTCFNFNRICAKLLNEIDGVDAYILKIKTEDAYHFKLDFSTDKLAVKLDATCIRLSYYDDMTLAKLGLPLENVTVIYDEEGS